MGFRYSPEFTILVSSPTRLKKLLEECSFGGSFEAWEQRKSFIAEAINKDGTFLDIGSGNGFLLRSLQEWSSFNLIPYGIDVNADYINGVKEVFPESAENFTVMDAKNIEDISDHGLPQKYDFIFYSSIWREISETNLSFQLINKLPGYLEIGGRLIIGFYDQDKSNNMDALQKLKSLGVKFSGELQNPQDTNLIAWMNSQ